MPADRKRPTIITEGPDAADAFDATIRQILTVDKPEMERREAEYQRVRATKVPRGPQPGRSYRRKTA